MNTEAKTNALPFSHINWSILSYKLEQNTETQTLVYVESGNIIHAGWVTDNILFISCFILMFQEHEAHDYCAEVSGLPYLSHSKVPHPPCGTGYSQMASYKQHRQSNLCAKSVLGHALLPVKQTNKQTKISSRIASPAISSWRTNTRQRCSKFFPSVSANSPPQKKEL